MPMPIALAHRLSYQLAQVRKLGLLPHLGPDGRAQVTVRYRDGVPVAVEKVIIVTQHQAGAEDRMEADLWHSVVLDVLPAGRYDAAGLRRSFFANPAGRFVTGGPGGDTGLTGRQIVVDTYGGFARHGGGAFSGQDPSKVGRSAAYGHFGRDDADFHLGGHRQGRRPPRRRRAARAGRRGLSNPLRWARHTELSTLS
jgi:S-adenosylmethionine synthetase